MIPCLEAGKEKRRLANENGSHHEGSENDDDLFSAPYATKTVENNITVKKLKELATE